MTRLSFKIRPPYKPFKSARADVGNFYHRSRRRGRIIKKYKNWARKYLKKNRYIPRPWYGKNSIERVQNLESKSPIRRRRLTTHAKQSRKHLRMRYHFHNTKPRSFYRTAYKAVMLGKEVLGPRNSLAYLLEGRIDSMLYRSNFVRTKRMMRQLIQFGSACVDGNIVSKPNHVVKFNQTVTLLTNPRDLKYRLSSRYGIFIKRGKTFKRRKKIVRQVKRYHKKTRKTYKKKKFLFLFKGVFDKNWIYRKKVTLKKLRALTNCIKNKKIKKIGKKLNKYMIIQKIKCIDKHKLHKFRPLSLFKNLLIHGSRNTVNNSKHTFKFVNGTKTICFLMNYNNFIKKYSASKNKKLNLFRLKFLKMVINLRNLMRIKRLVRISWMYANRKRGKMKGIAFTRYVFRYQNRRKIFAKHRKKRRFFVIAFHEFKRIRIKRAEISRYLFKLRKITSKRRSKIFHNKLTKRYLRRRKIKKRKNTSKKHTFYKKITLHIKPLCKSKFTIVSFEPLSDPIKVNWLAYNYYKILFKKIRIYRTRRLTNLRNLCLCQYYFFLLA